MSSSYHRLYEQNRAQIREVDVHDARSLIDVAGAAALDVREQDEVDQGRVLGAVHIPRGYLELRVEETLRDKEQPVIVYCAGGVRSAFAAKSLQDLGYKNVVSLIGGFTAWKGAGAPWEMPQTLTSDQRRRYARHLLIPEVGEEGQKKLLNAKVLLVGAGGLGSPAALYLAAAGIGTLGIVDADLVDDSNLQRQVIHSVSRIGMSKVASAKSAIGSINPDVAVICHEDRLTRDNVREIFSLFDIVIDGSDNFETRYLINDACVLFGKPNIHGSIFRFEGHATTFIAGEGPCYRCLFPNPPPAELAPSCAEAGVLGILPGIIGLIQATEAIKLVLGIGKPLVGRFLTYDALTTTFRDLVFKRDPRCQICRPGAKISLDGGECSNVAAPTNFNPQP